MGSKRFRIPDGHLAFWQFADPKTGRVERFDTMADKVRGKFTYFFFLSDLPDLSPLDFQDPRKRDDMRFRLTSVVMREAETPFPVLVEQRDGHFIFAERLTKHLISRGFQTISRSILKKEGTRVWLIRSGIGITQIEWSKPGDRIECFHPYAMDIIVMTVVIGGDVPESACFHGRRVVEKLRSFEY